MKKLILVIEVQDECDKVSAYIACEDKRTIAIHSIDYDADDIKLRERAFYIAEDKLKELGVF